MFSRAGTYPAVGLFSTTHIVSIIVCFVAIFVAVFFTRKMSKETYFKILKVFAIVVTALELFKIIWVLAGGERNVNAWVSLYFCSIFIYALWFTFSKNKFIKEMGLSFIAMAGIIAGAVFIISPSTSFNTYPIFHFQCLYSMLYHSLMVYSGIMIFVTRAVKIDFKLFFKYCIFCAIFMVLAIIVNVAFDGNMMFFATPSGIPLSILFKIYDFSHIAYTITMILVHLSLGLIVLGLYNLIEIIIKNAKKE